MIQADQNNLQFNTLFSSLSHCITHVNLISTACRHVISNISLCTVAVLVLVSRWQTALFYYFTGVHMKYWELFVNAFWSRSDMRFTFPGCLCSVPPYCVWLCSIGVSKAAQLLSGYTHVTLIQYLCVCLCVCMCGRVCVCVCVCWATEGLRLTYITRTITVKPVPPENCNRTQAENVSETFKHRRRIDFRRINIIHLDNILY